MNTNKKLVSKVNTPLLNYLVPNLANITNALLQHQIQMVSNIFINILIFCQQEEIIPNESVFKNYMSIHHTQHSTCPMNYKDFVAIINQYCIHFIYIEPANFKFNMWLRNVETGQPEYFNCINFNDPINRIPENQMNQLLLWLQDKNPIIKYKLEYAHYLKKHFSSFLKYDKLGYYMELVQILLNKHWIYFGRINKQSYILVCKFNNCNHIINNDKTAYNENINENKNDKNINDQNKNDKNINYKNKNTINRNMDDKHKNTKNQNTINQNIKSQNTINQNTKSQNTINQNIADKNINTQNDTITINHTTTIIQPKNGQKINKEVKKEEKEDKQEKEKYQLDKKVKALLILLDLEQYFDIFTKHAIDIEALKILCDDFHINDFNNLQIKIEHFQLIMNAMMRLDGLINLK